MLPRRVYAHRGASAELPENTMPAFERAVAIGVDALEMDVQLTRDGHLIVMHDDVCSRVTGALYRWDQLDLAEARALDAGWGFVAPDGTRPFAGQGITITTFAEVLDAFPTMLLNVDLKTAATVDPMLELIESRRAAERVILASFDTRTIVRVRRRKYAGATALSQGEVAALAALPAMLWRPLPYTGTAAQLPTHSGPLRFDRQAFIAKCHSIGLRVDFWTIDDPEEAARLLALGADGIITNDPRAIRPVIHAA